MQYRISREQALKSFIDLVSKKEGFKEEYEKFVINQSYYMYLNNNNIQDFKNKIKKYHFNHKQCFVIVDNVDTIEKFSKNGFSKSSFVISDKSPILKTTLGKFDEKKLLEALLLNVSDVYKYNSKYQTDKRIIGLRQFDTVVQELDLYNNDIITVSFKVLSEIIKLAKQIRNKYGLRVCNKNNIWSYVKDSDGLIADVVYEINEQFVANNQTQTINKYNLYTRYFELITYTLEVLEYKIKNEVEDPSTINELYYKNLSQYANGLMYLPEEISKMKIVRSKIVIGQSKIKNLKDYLTDFNERNPENKISEDTFKQVDTLAELAKQIIQEHPEAKDTSKLLTPDICFINKIYVEEHLNDEHVLKYQTELNNLLNMVSDIKDNSISQTAKD